MKSPLVGLFDRLIRPQSRREARYVGGIGKSATELPRQIMRNLVSPVQFEGSRSIFRLSDPGVVQKIKVGHNLRDLA